MDVMEITFNILGLEGRHKYLIDDILSQLNKFQYDAAVEMVRLNNLAERWSFRDVSKMFREQFSQTGYSTSIWNNYVEMGLYPYFKRNLSELSTDEYGSICLDDLVPFIILRGGLSGAEFTLTKCDEDAIIMRPVLYGRRTLGFMQLNDNLNWELYPDDGSYEHAVNSLVMAYSTHSASVSTVMDIPKVKIKMRTIEYEQYQFSEFSSEDDKPMGFFQKIKRLFGR